MPKYHILMGRRVPVDKYDSDHLLRTILKLSKLCNKFALKHTKSMNKDDGGVWVARGFVSTRRTKNGSQWEIATMGDSPIIVVEKFMTMLDEHYKKYGAFREKLDTQDKPKKSIKGKESE